MIRITGGIWRGRRLKTPAGEATRPSADAYRETLMSILGPDLDGFEVLDLFAGSGAFGLESLSRGAASAVFVEKGRAQLRTIKKNIESLRPDPDRVRVVMGNVYRMPPVGGPFDIVFVAPPYPHFEQQADRIATLLGKLGDERGDLLKDDGVVVVQAATGQFGGKGIPGLHVARERRFGRTLFTLLERGDG